MIQNMIWGEGEDKNAYPSLPKDKDIEAEQGANATVRAMLPSSTCLCLFV